MAVPLPRMPRMSEDRAGVVQPEVVDVIAVLADFGFGVDAAQQEVERSVEIAGEDRLARPRGLLLARPVEGQRNIGADRIALECPQIARIVIRCAQHAVGPVRDQRVCDRREIGVRPRNEGLGRYARGNSVRCEESQRVQGAGITAAIEDTEVVVLAGIDRGFLIYPRKRQVHGPDPLIEMGLQLQFVGEVFGRERGVDRAHIVGLVEIGVSVGAIDAA